jgi:hypothetical protein
MEISSSAQLGFVEKLLQGLDEGLPGALFRLGVGFATIPAVHRLFGIRDLDWALVLGLFAVLFLLRVVPAIIRKIIPFSQEVRVIWWKRRQLAKRYDSYQWRKLFWIGAGMAIYMVAYRDVSFSHATVSSVCILAGAIGLVRWRVLRSQSQQSKSTSQKVIRPVV